jgi:predicted DNA-binding WGR domain protein
MFNVTHYYGVHKENTKDYHLYLIEAPKTGALLVKSWGKRGTTGQCKVELAGNASSGQRLLNQALSERASKGYDMRVMTVSGGGAYSDLAAALAVLPAAHQRSITNAQLSVLDPDSYSQTDKSPFDPLKAQREDMVRKAERQDTTSAAEKAEADQILKSNPIFGMF